MEEYLKEQGYIPNRYNHKRKEWENCDKYTISSMVDLVIRFTKENHKDVWFGLNEYGFPPTLVSPRPMVAQDKGDHKVLYEASDAQIVELQAKWGSGRLLECALGREILDKQSDYATIGTFRYRSEITPSDPAPQ